tara:strand:- start:1172 stop:2032 length:861 start_codon:yes stop_codon:yes gene_type:complete
MKKRLIEDIDRINQLLGLNEMRFDNKSTGLFSDEETTMNELEIDESPCGDSDLDEGDCGGKELQENDLEYDPTKVVHNDEDHIVVDKDMEDEEFTYDKEDVSYMDDEWLVIDKDEETTMNELDDEEEEELGWEGDPWDYIEYGGFMDDDDEEEELPTVRRSDRDRARRRPYSPKARFRGGLSEQERPPLALDRDLTFILDEIHDDLFYTLPGQFQEYNLGEQVRLYQELKSRLDSYPSSKSLPEVKQILDRMEYDLSGLEGFNERLGHLFYILTGRYEFSPESRKD